MKFSEKFIKNLGIIPTMCLHKCYEDYVESTHSNISFIDWVETYKEFPDILKNMCK